MTLTQTSREELHLIKREAESLRTQNVTLEDLLAKQKAETERVVQGETPFLTYILTPHIPLPYTHPHIHPTQPTHTPSNQPPPPPPFFSIP